MPSRAGRPRLDGWTCRRLTAAGGRLDPAATLDLLRDVAQGSTQWSIAYDLAESRAVLVTGKHYADVRELRLPGR